VWGEGPLTAKLWVVGQDPGENEVIQGRPFVPTAPAGRMLNGALKLACVKREEVYITNVRKCLPPKNASAEDLELALLHCAPYLDSELLEGNPNCILSLGAPALLRLTGRKELVKKWQGSLFKADECGFDNDSNGTRRDTPKAR